LTGDWVGIRADTWVSPNGLGRHFSGNFPLGVGFLQIMDDFIQHHLPRQPKAIELGQTVNPQENRHVMPLERDNSLRGKHIEQVERKDIKWVWHAGFPKPKYPVADS